VQSATTVIKEDYRFIPLGVNITCVRFAALQESPSNVCKPTKLLPGGLISSTGHCTRVLELLLERQDPIESDETVSQLAQFESLHNSKRKL